MTDFADEDELDFPQPKIPGSAPEYFYQITPDRILRCVESTGVRCTGRVLQLNSLENRVYEAEIEVKDPARLPSRYDAFRVIKFYRPGRWSKEQIQDEHSFLLDLQKKELPVVAPLPITPKATVGADQESGIFYAVFPKAGGRLEDELNKAQLERLGRTVARIHQCGLSRAAKKRLRLTVDTYGYEPLKIVLDKKIIPGTFAERVESLVKQVLEICKARLSDIPIQRIHGDLHLGNILWLNESCSLVDFDDMLVGPVVQDVWLLFPGRDEDSEKRREVFLNAYREITHFNPDHLELTEVLRSLRMIRFLGWIAARWEDPSFPRMFPTFTRHEYWNDHYLALSDQLRRLEGREW